MNLFPSTTIRALLIAGLFTPALSFGIELVAVGDIMPGSAHPFSSELPPNDGKNLFSASQALFTDADVVFGNLEAVLIDDVSLVRDCPPASTSCYRFGTPTRYVAHLKEAGFNVLNSANNHVHDFDVIGRQTTIATVDHYGLTGFGTLERPSTTQVLPNGIKIGWVGFAPHTGANPPSLQTVRDQVAELKRHHDLVFMTMHIGAEGSSAQHITRETEIFLGQNRGNPYALAHAAIDAGADMVIGHGPHVLRGMELYKGHLIAYSLGNFATYGRFNLKGPNAVAGVLRVTLNQEGEFVQGQFTGTRQDRTSAAWQQGITPVLDDSGEAITLLRNLSQQDFPESTLIIGTDGKLSRPDLPVEVPEAPAPQSQNKPISAKPQAQRTQLGNSRWSTIRQSFQAFYTRSRNAVRNLASN